MPSLKKRVWTLLPRHIRHAIQAWAILENDYGHMRSAREWASVDRHGKPVPWYTYPAIEYIRQFDLSEKRVFEYGSGNSSLFWAGIAKEVISVEQDRTWYDRIRQQAPPNNQLHLAEDRETYINLIHTFDTVFDVIIVDGNWRKPCAEQAIKRLHPNGMVILDNADWFVQSAALLRSADLIEVDMHGFGPINNYTYTTSFFLTRGFNFASRGDHQPAHGIGSRKQFADEDAL